MDVLNEFLSALIYYAMVTNVSCSFNTDCKDVDLVAGIDSFVNGGRHDEITINKEKIKLERDHLDYIAVHELIHIKRNDGFKLNIFDKLSYLFSVLTFPILFLLAVPIYFLHYEKFRSKIHGSWFRHIIMYKCTIKQGLCNKYQKIIETQNDFACLEYISLDKILEAIRSRNRAKNVGVIKYLKKFFYYFTNPELMPPLYDKDHESASDLLNYIKNNE